MHFKAGLNTSQTHLYFTWSVSVLATAVCMIWIKINLWKVVKLSRSYCSKYTRTNVFVCICFFCPSLTAGSHFIRCSLVMDSCGLGYQHGHQHFAFRTAVKWSEWLLEVTVADTVTSNNRKCFVFIHSRGGYPNTSYNLARNCQILPGPAPNSVLRVLQTSSKSVHFRRSYSRTCEHRQIAP